MDKKWQIKKHPIERNYEKSLLRNIIADLYTIHSEHPFY